MHFLKEKTMQCDSNSLRKGKLLNSDLQKWNRAAKGVCWRVCNKNRPQWTLFPISLLAGLQLVSTIWIPAIFVEQFKPNDCGGIKQSGGIWNLQSDNAGLETELSCAANAHSPPSDKCAYVQMHDVQFDKYAKHLSRTHLHLHSGPKTCF